MVSKRVVGKGGMEGWQTRVEGKVVENGGM